MRAEEFLQQIVKIEKQIENKQAEANHWRAIATNSTTHMSGDKGTSSPNPHRTEEAIAKYMDLEREAEKCVDALIAAKVEIISTIEKLNAAEYDVLHKIYIQGFDLQEVASKYGRSYSWATTMHWSAKKNLQKILNERNAEKARET